MRRVRAGEQWAARWRDVDFVKHELRVSRRVDVYGEESAPKSIAGVRTVPLSDQLVAMRKTWRIKSQFSRMDDLIFPNRNGRYFGHDNLIKRPADVPRTYKVSIASIGMGSATLPSRAGLKPASQQRRCRLSPGMHRYRSRWIDTATCSQATITGRRWTRSPVDYSRDPRQTFPEQTPLIVCHSCDMDAPGRDDARWDSLDFIAFLRHQAGAAEFGDLAQRKAR